MGLITAVHRRRPWCGSSSLLLHHKEHRRRVFALQLNLSPQSAFLTQPLRATACECTSDIEISSTRPAIPSWGRIGSSTSGGKPLRGGASWHCR